MTPEALGRYHLQDELGRGAMGVVYRAVDPALDRAVAIKVISLRQSGVVETQEAEARFLRESRLAARLVHPNVVTVHDAGREGDTLYLVMELVEGRSLAATMAAGHFPETAQALELAAQVADALGAAHRMGVVHRDVKPANILLTPDGQVKVSDFGVARAIGEGTTLTRTGMVVGSPAYMSPEQLRGELTDGRSDIFSLGIVLFELLLRRRPFPADTVTTLIYQILNNDPFADAEVGRTLDEPLRDFLAASLAKAADERIPDAPAFAERARELAVERLGAVEETAPTVIAPAPQAEAPVAAASAKPAGEHRPPVGVIVGASAVVLALVLGAVALLGTRGSDTVVLEPVPTTAVAGAAATVPEPTQERPLPVAGPASQSRDAAMEAAVPADTTAAAVEADPATAEPELTMAGAEPAVELPVAVPTALPTALPTPAPAVVATFQCRSGAEFNVSPEEAEVAVEGRVIGIADDWDGMGGGEVFTFPGPGVYFVRLSLEGYQTAWVKVVVSADAEDDVADIDTELEQIDD